MRLLLVFLLIGFHLGGFAGNDIPVASGKHFSEINDDKKDVLQINEASDFEKLTAHLSRSHNLKNNCQHRQIPFARFTNNIVSTKNTIIEIRNALFVAHECYCKPIRLLLLFPQHYFW